MFSEVIEGQLLRGSRPGYAGERGRQVAKEEVDAWLEELRGLGAKSIICILGDDQLGLYQSLPVPLYEYYRSAGFEAEHVSARDHQYPALNGENLSAVWTYFQKLTKPVLVHCSAGMDRTGMAVRYIQSQLEESR